MSEDDISKLKMLDLRRSFTSLVKPSCEIERFGTGICPDPTGYSRLTVVCDEVEKLNSGLAAQEWAEGPGFPARISVLRLRAALQFELFWLMTGAPTLSKPYHLHWMVGAFINGEILKRNQQSVVDHAVHFAPNIRLIRQFAAFCRNLPVGHSDLADALRVGGETRGGWNDYNRCFKPTVQRNGQRYLSLIPGRYHFIDGGSNAGL